MLDISKLQTLFEPLFPGLLGVELQEAEKDLVQATMKIRPDLCSGVGSAHWGALVGLAQTLGAVGSVLNLPENYRTKTLSTNTQFHAEAPAGDTVTAVCVPDLITEDRMIWKTRITNNADELCAEITQTQEVFPEA
ncbi:MAG: PaaI family thioesterase [Burkholderiaceae bacterium]